MQKINLLLSVIVFATLTRVALPPSFIHLPNFSALDALALFCGAYCNKRSSAIMMTLAAIWLGDILLTHSLFYPGWYWQYASYSLIALLGATLNNKVSVFSVSAASLCGSVLFFVVTNFGVWFSSMLYPHTIDGLLTCYTAAIPFFQTTLISDLLFAGVFFGSYFFINNAHRVFPPIQQD